MTPCRPSSPICGQSWRGKALVSSISAASGAILSAAKRAVDPFLAAQMLNATLNAGAELGFWVPGVRQKAAPAVFARPMLMGIFAR